MIKIVLIDDQALVRQAFSLMISLEDDMEIIGQASDGIEAVELIKRTRPDLALMDVQMPGLDGIAATKALVGQPTRVIILTTFDTDQYLFDALNAGAAGFLLKNSTPEQLLAGIRAVHDGHSLLAPEVTRRVIESRTRHLNHTNPRMSSLTEREHQVLVLMAKGCSNAEIADSLFVSEATVKTHVSKVLAKLEVRDRVQAVILAYQAGVMS